MTDKDEHRYIMFFGFLIIASMFLAVFAAIAYDIQQGYFQWNRPCATHQGATE